MAVGAPFDGEFPLQRGELSMGAEQDLLYQKDGQLAWITVNRPEQRNAFTFEMYDRLAALCEEVDADPEVRVMIVRGAGGRSFASGTDIRQFLDFSTEADALGYEEMITGRLARVAQVGKPTIAMIEGFCVGGGFGLAMSCDLRYCTPESRFGAPPARLGNIFAPGNTARLLQQIGPARAMDMLFTARQVPADEAYAMGLVSAVVAQEALEAKVREVAATICGNAPITIRETKKLIQRMLAEAGPSWRGEEYVLACYMSEDFKEGVRAFLEKRPPRWQGR
jgi:enoyl-CoA hydratase